MTPTIPAGDGEAIGVLPMIKPDRQSAKGANSAAGKPTRRRALNSSHASRRVVPLYVNSRKYANKFGIVYQGVPVILACELADVLTAWDRRWALLDVLLFGNL